MKGQTASQTLKQLDFTNFTTAHHPRSYANAMVRHHHPFTPADRLDAALKAGWNVFQFPSERLTGGDLLSDSGTTTLTAEQFSALMLGDEAYGSNWGYFKLMETMENVFGISFDEWEFYLFHQGRAAEHALFGQIKGENLIVPCNSFFDTTRANAEACGIDARDLVGHVGGGEGGDFKGNMDLEKLEKLLEENKGRVPLVFSTITNNTAGGQPVSLDNLRATQKLCDRYDIPFFLDACRFAENAWFIEEREKGYKDKPIIDIVHEEFAACEGFTISFKKDGLANMGGALCIRKDSRLVRRYPDLLEKLRDHQILVEGHPTYGGLSGRDIMTIVIGLQTAVRDQYLRGRIGQVAAFGAYMQELGIPVVAPFGGHAVYIDTDKFFAGTKFRRGHFGGISLTALLLLKGVRLCELGAFAFGTFNPQTQKETFPQHNLVRAAVPRNKYEMEDLFYVADCVKGLYVRRDALPRAVAVYGKDKTLRHFKARFALEDF